MSWARSSRWTGGVTVVWHNDIKQPMWVKGLFTSPRVTRGMKRERLRERENWQARVSMWGAGKGKEVARENAPNEKERECQKETGRQVSAHVKEKEGAKEQEWRSLSIWNTHQTRTKETFPSPNSTLMSDLQSLSITYCKSSQNIHIHTFLYNNLI